MPGVLRAVLPAAAFRDTNLVRRFGSKIPKHHDHGIQAVPAAG